MNTYLDPILDNTTINNHHFTDEQKQEFTKRFDEELAKFYADRNLDPASTAVKMNPGVQPDQQEILHIAEIATHGLNAVAQQDDNPDTVNMSDAEFHNFAERVALPIYISNPLEHMLTELDNKGFTEEQKEEFSARYMAKWEELCQGTDEGFVSAVEFAGQVIGYSGYLEAPNADQRDQMLDHALHGLNSIAQTDGDEATVNMSHDAFQSLKGDLTAITEKDVKEIGRYYDDTVRRVDGPVTPEEVKEEIKEIEAL
jgi:hypothetical protein